MASIQLLMCLLTCRAFNKWPSLRLFKLDGYIRHAVAIIVTKAIAMKHGLVEDITVAIANSK